MRRAGAAALALLLTWALLEVASWLLFERIAGVPLDLERLSTDRRGRLAAIRTVLEHGEASDLGVVPHPYVGYVGRPGAASRYLVRDDGGVRFNDYGMIADPRAVYPSELRPGDFVVGVLGGSVAEIFAIRHAATLEKHLRQAEPRFDRRVVLVNLAASGFKQPQQLFHLEYALLLGFRFDAVVNLDGFNDLAFAVENAAKEIHPILPSAYHMGTLLEIETRGVLAPDAVEALGRFYDAHRRERAVHELLEGSPLGRSPFANLAGLTLARREIARAAAIRFRAAREGGTGIPPELRGPRSPWPSDPHGAAAALWARSSRMLAAICDDAGIPYLHFLQPNQYVEGSRVFAPGEEQRAIRPGHPWGAAARLGYPLLREEGRRLREEGVRFYDLSLALRDLPQPVYVDDCCHFGPAGNAIVSKSLAAVLKLELGERLWKRESGDE